MTKLKPVSITALSPEDIAHVGFDTRLITQDEIETLAAHMAESYIGHRFWHDLEWFAEHMDLPRI